MLAFLTGLVVAAAGLWAWSVRNDTRLAQRLGVLGLIVCLLMPIGWLLTRFLPRGSDAKSATEVQTEHKDLVLRVSIVPGPDAVLGIERPATRRSELAAAVERAPERAFESPWDDLVPISTESIEWRLSQN